MSQMISVSAPRLMGSPVGSPFGVGGLLASPSSRAGDVMRRLGARVVRVFSNRKAIAQLSTMDDRLLSDIGLSRGDVRAAADIGAFGRPMTVLDMRAADRAARALAPGARQE